MCASMVSSTSEAVKHGIELRQTLDSTSGPRPGLKYETECKVVLFRSEHTGTVSEQVVHSLRDAQTTTPLIIHDRVVSAELEDKSQLRIHIAANTAHRRIINKKKLLVVDIVLVGSYFNGSGVRFTISSELDETKKVSPDTVTKHFVKYEKDGHPHLTTRHRTRQVYNLESGTQLHITEVFTHRSLSSVGATIGSDAWEIEIDHTSSSFPSESTMRDVLAKAANIHKLCFPSSSLSD